MTEQEWLTCTDTHDMLVFLGDKASDRKLRLVAAACCRRLLALVADLRLQEAVEVVERYADGLTTEADLADVYRKCDNDGHYESEPVAFYLQTTALYLTWHSALQADWDPSIRERPAAFAAKNAPVCSVNTVAALAERDGGKSAGRAACSPEEAAQATLLREIFSNPFRPQPAVDSCWLSWNDSTIPKLTHAIYEDRGFDRLPILADALEEAGCDNADILNHCRQPGEHVRGCWVVDLLLNKS
ncbi:MAG TPA: hypothetical protein VH643_08815 [Gemmataceae bacterium]|jgi:hypothetical protein